MPSRILVLGTAATPAARQTLSQIASLLENAGPLTPADTLAGQSLAAVVSDPAKALAESVMSVRSLEGDRLLIAGLESAPTPSFDVLGWNLDVAANTAATVVAVVDAVGMSEELASAEIASLARRAAQHHAAVAAVVVIGAPGAGASLDADFPFAVVDAPAGKEVIEAALGLVPSVVTPLMFQSDLLARAASDRRRIVLPEPSDERVLRATEKLLALGVADVILVGESAEVEAKAAELGLDISGASIVSRHDPELVEKYAAEFARLRAKKGVTIEQARQKVQDETYFATMMVQMGDADGMVSGAIHTTANTIVPAFQIIKTAPGISLVSSSFLMLLADQVLVMGDCAVNPNPTPDQLAEIAVSTAQTAQQFGIDPLVAMLSYSTGSSGSGADVEAVIAATDKVRELAPELPVEGPIQYDAAVDPAVGSSKAPGSAVAGRANVLIFPNLGAGNIGYKAVQRSAHAVAVGPILQGLRRPVNDLSRGALVEDIVNTVAITAVQAQAEGA